MATARERVYDKVRNRIFSGKYPPGYQLKEEILAEEMSVSRTPVRVALHKLADEGLVTVRSNHRTYVSDVNEAQFEEIFELIAFLESYSASLAARRISAEDVARLRKLVDQMEALVNDKPGDHRAFLENNAQFHSLIHASHGNQTVKEVLDRVVNFPHNLYLKFGQIHAAHNPKSVQQHRAIVDALASGDPEYASLQFRAHTESVRRAFRELWGQLDDKLAQASSEKPAGRMRASRGTGR
jgi:DNA-binding GntR family transcriptional regulator